MDFIVKIDFRNKTLMVNKDKIMYTPQLQHRISVISEANNNNRWMFVTKPIMAETKYKNKHYVLTFI